MKKRTISWPLRFLILCIVIIVLGIAGLLLWQDGVSPVDESDEKSLTFTVEKGESIRAIAGRLASQRLIRSRTVFFLLVKLKGIDDEIQAGDFHVARSMKADEIADALTHGAIDVWITTLEGWRVEEIATKLTEELKIPGQEFIAASEEGYMFPDTYLIPKNTSGASVAAIFRANFDKRVTQEMRETASSEGLTIDQVVILASLVEREGRNSVDRPLIAGVLLNRMKLQMPLDVDATLQYAKGYSVSEKSWWKKNLTDEDKRIDSPYNTYKNAGLPPGPISNPGLVSINAVLHPTPSDYIFYLHDPSGEAHFAKSLREHEENIDKYLR